MHFTYVFSFQISSANALLVTGFVTEKDNKTQYSSITETECQYDIHLNENDVYALLSMKGYSYQ